MSNQTLLLITLIMYLISLYVARKFDMKVLMFSAILWFVPITVLENMFLIVFSVIMMILHVIYSLGVFNNEDF